MQKDLKEQFARCIELMQKDVAEFEAKYQGRFAEEPHVGLGNRKTRCVNEATLPIITCHPSCLAKCAGTCYVINICTKPRPNCRKVEAKNTVLRRIDPNAYYEYFYREAERLHLPIRLSDGGDFENAEQVRPPERTRDPVHEAHRAFAGACRPPREPPRPLLRLGGRRSGGGGGAPAWI